MSDVYSALAHPARRKILALLREKRMSAGELADQFDLAKPTLSGHFTILKNAGLITAERKGTTIFYRLNTSVMQETIAALMTLVGQGEEKPEGAPCKSARP